MKNRRRKRGAGSESARSDTDHPCKPRPADCPAHRLDSGRRVRASVQRCVTEPGGSFAARASTTVDELSSLLEEAGVPSTTASSGPVFPSPTARQTSCARSSPTSSTATNASPRSPRCAWASRPGAASGAISPTTSPWSISRRPGPHRVLQDHRGRRRAHRGRRDRRHVLGAGRSRRAVRRADHRPHWHHARDGPRTPTIDEVLPRFVAFAADSVLVARDAHFDLAFLDYELGFLAREAFPRPALDTAPGTPAHAAPRAARSACRRTFGLPTNPEHRALPDAMATGGYLPLLSRLEEQDVTTLEEVARICGPEARRNSTRSSHRAAADGAGRVHHARRARRTALHRQGREPPPPRARPLLQRQAYGATQALELLEKIDIVETGSSSPPCSSRAASSAPTGRPATATARASRPTAT